MELIKDDQFYDEGKPFEDAEFDKAEDGHLREITKPEPFVFSDSVNALLASIARH